MKEYEKIETVFARDLEGSKKLIQGTFRNSAVQFLAPLDWEWTEKIDGTNIRIYWDGHAVSIAGRTDKAQLPQPLTEKLNSLFMTDAAEELFEQMFGEKEVILFGEGYGHKIQKVGNKYIKDDVNFILFDVCIRDNYQDRQNTESIARAFGIQVVPIVGVGSLYDAIEFMKQHPNSTIATEPVEMEGVVCRPKVEMRDRCGNRLIVKIKWNDMKELV